MEESATADSDSLDVDTENVQENSTDEEPVIPETQTDSEDMVDGELQEEE